MINREQFSKYSMAISSIKSYFFTFLIFLSTSRAIVRKFL